MNIENVPLIVSFNNWAKELPPEHRSKAYKFAESFLCVGGMHGAFVGAHGAIASISGAISDSEDVPKKSSGDEQKEYMAYLQAKAEENKV